MYPAYMEESIRNVEATREKRLKETFPRLSDKEKTPLLQKYHPDYVPGSMRQLLLGTNKGDYTPNELANLLEGNSRINPDKINLNKADYDVDVPKETTADFYKAWNNEWIRHNTGEVPEGPSVEDVDPQLRKAVEVLTGANQLVRERPLKNECSRVSGNRDLL